MTNYFIDTNCLLSYVTDRNRDQQNRIAPYFSGASVLKHKITVIQNVVTEFVYVCLSVYKIEPARVREMVLDFIHTPGMEVEYSFPISTFMHLWPAYIENYGDAVLAASVPDAGGVLLSFDGKLRKNCARLDISVEEL
jgi:predicted nucleic-acid-binding protein